MLLRIKNNSGGTVSNVVDGGWQYVSVTSVICNASGVITYYKADNSGSYAAVPSGHIIDIGELGRNKVFNILASSDAGVIA